MPLRTSLIWNGIWCYNAEKEKGTGIQSAISHIRNFNLTKWIPLSQFISLLFLAKWEVRDANRRTREKHFDYRPAGRVIGRGDR